MFPVHTRLCAPATVIPPHYHEHIISLATLQQAFKVVGMQIKRLYYSVTVGVPDKLSGEICTNIDRHPTDRLRMAVHGFGSIRGRQAISTYRCA